MTRTATVSRETKETQITLTVNLDGEGASTIQSGVPFLDHMLTLFSKHSGIDLNCQAKGDIEIDGHHTTEDIGICLGQAIFEALGDKSGIQRYAAQLVPMDESLCQIAIDISNRPYLNFKSDQFKGKIGQFDSELVPEFFRALVNNLKITCHINILEGYNLHHIAEASFKGLGLVLGQAISVNPNKPGIPSTKGVL